MKNLLLALAVFVVIISCKKKPVITPVTIAERIEITTPAASVLSNNSTVFTIKYYNNMGQVAPAPANITWQSNNNNIATVNGLGVATGISVGQATITATYNSNIVATALLSVVANPMQLATIGITPASPLELKLNEAFSLQATGYNLNGGIVSGLNFNWATQNNSIANLSSTTVVGANYGTTNITAASSGIQSAPLVVQVIRKGSFVTAGSGGMAKLKIESGMLRLQTTPDFVSSLTAPDLRIFLTNNTNSIAGGLLVAPLIMRTGAQIWDVPTNPSITQYRYALIWCVIANIAYGYADLGL